MKLSKLSLALLVIQLALVSSIAAKYLYQRSTCPRVWTRAAMHDSTLPMRGRYLSVQLTVDGCGSTLPSARDAAFPRNIDGVPRGATYFIAARQPVQFPATLAVKGNKLVAFRILESNSIPAGQMVSAWPDSSCENMRLDVPVNFYIAEHAASPLPLKADQELWIEVTVPPQGPPRPLQLALKQNGAWQPLASQ